MAGCTTAQEQVKKNCIRNWPEYNERLVRRGEMYMDLDFVERWDEGIKGQNEGERHSYGKR